MDLLSVLWSTVLLYLKWVIKSLFYSSQICMGCHYCFCVKRFVSVLSSDMETSCHVKYSQTVLDIVNNKTSTLL